MKHEHRINYGLSTHNDEMFIRLKVKHIMQQNVLLNNFIFKNSGFLPVAF